MINRVVSPVFSCHLEFTGQINRINQVSNQFQFNSTGLGSMARYRYCSEILNIAGEVIALTPLDQIHEIESIEALNDLEHAEFAKANRKYRSLVVATKGLTPHGWDVLYSENTDSFVLFFK